MADDELPLSRSPGSHRAPGGQEPHGGLTRQRPESCRFGGFGFSRVYEGPPQANGCAKASPLQAAKIPSYCLHSRERLPQFVGPSPSPFRHSLYISQHLVMPGVLPCDALFSLTMPDCELSCQLSWAPTIPASYRAVVPPRPDSQLHRRPTQGQVAGIVAGRTRTSAPQSWVGPAIALPRIEVLWSDVPVRISLHHARVEVQWWPGARTAMWRPRREKWPLSTAG